jgi:anti-sigma regulatory factor (Ser/Thr protein kinase)
VRLGRRRRAVGEDGIRLGAGVDGTNLEAAMGGTAEMSIVLDASTSQVAHARRFVRQQLGTSVPNDVAADLQLVASELFTNAIEHGLGSVVEVAVESTPEFVGVSVASDGIAPDVGAVAGWSVAAADAPSGRGLGIVRALADELIVERADGRFVVTARRSRPSAD